MNRILDYNGQSVVRTETVASLQALKQSGRKVVQVTANDALDAAAAEQAGIELLICLAQRVPDVRAGSQNCFLTAAIDFGGEITPDDLLNTAMTALSAGADAVITARRLEVVELLAAEDIPVLGHLGFVPKKSTVLGGVRSVGKTGEEAAALWSKFQALENAGAFGVECELIPANVMSEINRRTNLVTYSLGSGPDADVSFLFMNDICGEEGHLPRHARRYADVAKLREEIEATRVDALTRFRSDALSGAFPATDEIVVAPDDELARFIELIDRS